MSRFLANSEKILTQHDESARLITKLIEWLVSTERVRNFVGFEDDPDVEQAYLWTAKQDETARSEGRILALADTCLKPGDAVDLAYWMTEIPSSLAPCLSVIGQDANQGLLSGFALWTPQGGTTKVVHVSEPGVFAASIGTTKDFLRALSLPISSLSQALRTESTEPALANPAYLDWLAEMGIPPADVFGEALSELVSPKTDVFRDWLRQGGYTNAYFLG